MKFFNSQNFSGVTTGPVMLNFYRPAAYTSSTGVDFYRKLGNGNWRKFNHSQGKYLTKATDVFINYAYAGGIHRGAYTLEKTTITKMPPHTWKYTFTLNRFTLSDKYIWDYSGAVFVGSKVKDNAGVTPVYQISFLFSEETEEISDISWVTFEDRYKESHSSEGGMLELVGDFSGESHSIYMRKYDTKYSIGTSANPTDLRDDMTSDTPFYTSFFGTSVSPSGQSTSYKFNNGACAFLKHTPSSEHISEGWAGYFYLLQLTGYAWDPNAPDDRIYQVTGGFINTNGASGWGSGDLEFNRNSYPSSGV